MLLGFIYNIAVSGLKGNYFLYLPTQHSTGWTPYIFANSAQNILGEHLSTFWGQRRDVLDCLTPDSFTITLV